MRLCAALAFFPDRFMDLPVRLLAAAVFTFALAACDPPRPAASGQATAPAKVADGTRAELAILESTDIHSNILSYDYYRLAEDPSLGFERMATRVKEARREFANTMLFDDTSIR